MRVCFIRIITSTHRKMFGGHGLYMFVHVNKWNPYCSGLVHPEHLGFVLRENSFSHFVGERRDGFLPIHAFFCVSLFESVILHVIWEPLSNAVHNETRRAISSVITVTQILSLYYIIREAKVRKITFN